MDPQVAFRTLQPASVEVARDQSVESVQSLCRAVEQVLSEESNEVVDGGVSCINAMKEYLLFPLFIILKSGRKLSWKFQEEIVRCMLIILQHCSIEDFTIFQEIFSRLFILISNKENPREGINISEECKQETLKAVKILIHNSSELVLDKMNGHNFRPQLGHAVFMCLKIAQEEKNRGLKIEAVECLLALGQQKIFMSMPVRKQAVLSDNFANFLPGIVTGLAKIAIGDEKQGHRITHTALDAWTYFVVLVMRDEHLEGKISHLEESETVAQLRNKLFKDKNKENEKKNLRNERSKKFDIPGPDDDDPSPKLPSIEINRKWVNGTAEKLLVLIQSLSKLVSHSHWRVRLSLVQFAEKLILNCHKSLTGGVITALQIIVTLRSDDIVDIGSAAQTALLSVMNVIGAGGECSQVRKGVYELLEEQVYALCTQLPTIFIQQDDTKTLSSVRHLEGCLEVLGKRICQLMSWPTHSFRLLRSLRYGLTIDISDPDLLLERTSAEDPFGILNVKPSLGRNFKYFQDIRIFESISTACRLVGYHSSLTVISDLCLELLQETQHRNETFVIFTLVIQGRDKCKWREKEGTDFILEENEKIVRNVLDVIVDHGIFDAPLCINTSSTMEGSFTDDCTNADALIPVNTQHDLSVDIIKSNVILVSNALNLIGAMAEMIGKEFEMFLSDILCSVMEKAGDTNILVGYTGRNTLASIAQACEHESVARLIENSVPYYWYALSLKLKRLLQYPSAPLVLQVCLEYASIDVIAFTEELVQEVLLCLDTYHSDQSVPLLRVLLVYVMAVVRYESQLTGVKQKSTQQIADENHIAEPEDLSVFLKNYLENQSHINQSLKDEETSTSNIEEIKRGTGEDVEQDEDGAVDVDNQPEETKNEAPRYIKHVVEILEKCSHMLFFQERRLKLLILDIVKAGSEALANWENERLPACHKLWKPLVLRLKDVDFIVMIRAFEALTALSVSSGDFLRRRIIKEVLPAVFSFLKIQSIASLKKTRKSGYHMTTGYRAQHKLLKELPMLVRMLSFGPMERTELLSVLVLYLDCHQPPELLNLANDFVKEISATHPQLVWLALAYQQPHFQIVPPFPCLDSVMIKGSSTIKLNSDALELFKILS